MAHVFEGQPDGRQAATAIPVSRFRPRYRALDDDEKALHDEIKAKAAELEALFERARDKRFPPPEPIEVRPGDPVEMTEAILGFVDPAAAYFDDGMKSLELAVMWTVKGITS